jgi:hypothetical protein
MTTKTLLTILGVLAIIVIVFLLAQSRQPLSDEVLVEEATPLTQEMVSETPAVPASPQVPVAPTTPPINPTFPTTGFGPAN